MEIVANAAFHWYVDDGLLLQTGLTSADFENPSKHIPQEEHLYTFFFKYQMIMKEKLAFGLWHITTGIP